MVNIPATLEHYNIDSLIPYERNSRIHSDEQIERIAASIQEFGFTNPILIDGEHGIIAGHGRLAAAKKLGMEKVPVIQLAHLSDAQKQAYIIADNRLAELSEWNKELLAEELAELQSFDFDLSLIGFDDASLAEIMPAEKELQPLTDEDAVPEVDEQAPLKTKIGDVWILGSHRVMCGDSTDEAMVAQLMNGVKADITFTSPPYNAAKNDHLTEQVSGFDKKYIEHCDELSDDEYLELLVKSTNNAIKYSRFAFINIQLLTHNRMPLFQYQSKFIDKIKDVLIWNKKQCPPNIVKGAFNTKFEYVFCFSDDNKTRGFPCEWRGQYPNVIDTESNAGNEFAKDHKAGFPIAFPLWFLEKLDFVQSVFEPFCGSGSTLIACEKTERKCYGMELSPQYVELIIRRWQEYTGKEAHLEETGETFNSIASR